jgi:hypothetical protein
MAQQAAAPESERLMAAVDVRSGQPMPTLDEFDFRAEERVEVLEHHLSVRPFDQMGSA